MDHFDKYINEPTSKYYEKMRQKEHDPVICSHFGCGKELTLQEQLCGDKCTPHANLKKTDIMMIIPWPSPDQQ